MTGEQSSWVGVATPETVPEGFSDLYVSCWLEAEQFGVLVPVTGSPKSFKGGEKN